MEISSTSWPCPAVRLDGAGVALGFVRVRAAGIDLRRVDSTFLGDTLDQRLEAHRLEKRDQRFVVRIVHAEAFDRHIQRHAVVQRDKLLGHARSLGVVDEGLAALVLLDLVRALEQSFEIAIFADQLRRGFYADARDSGHVVGCVADQRLDLDHLVRRHAEFLDDLGNSDPRILHGVVHDHAVVHELHEVLVGGHDGCCRSGFAGHPRIGRDQVVRFVPCLLEARNLEGAHRVANERELRNEVIGRGRPMRLVLLVHLRAERLLGLVEDDREMRRPFVRLHFLEQLPQHVAEAINRIHMRAVGRARLEPDRMIGAENVAGAVDKKDVVALFHRSRSRRGGRGFCGRNFGGLAVSILRKQAWPECGPLHCLYQSAFRAAVDRTFRSSQGERLE